MIDRESFFLDCPPSTTFDEAARMLSNKFPLPPNIRIIPQDGRDIVRMNCLEDNANVAIRYGPRPGASKALKEPPSDMPQAIRMFRLTVHRPAHHRGFCLDQRLLLMLRRKGNNLLECPETEFQFIGP
jgi:hypothetical protein